MLYAPADEPGAVVAGTGVVGCIDHSHRRPATLETYDISENESRRGIFGAHDGEYTG